MLSGRAAESSRPKIEIPNLKFEVFKVEPKKRNPNNNQ